MPTNVSAATARSRHYNNDNNHHYFTPRQHYCWSLNKNKINFTKINCKNKFYKKKHVK